MPAFPALAIDKVRQVGDCVAVVLATSVAAAVDALDAIEVSYEALPAVTDMEAALESGSALVHDEIETNACYVYKMPCGDYEASRAKADVVVVSALPAHQCLRRMKVIRFDPRPHKGFWETKEPHQRGPHGATVKQ